MDRPAQPYPRNNRPIVSYSQHGAGTDSDPTYITFNFGGRPHHDPERLRALLPPTVRLEDDGAGHKLIGVDPFMSRLELYWIFTDLCLEMGWQLRRYE